MECESVALVWAVSVSGTGVDRVSHTYYYYYYYDTEVMLVTDRD